MRSEYTAISAFLNFISHPQSCLWVEKRSTQWQVCSIWGAQLVSKFTRAWRLRLARYSGILALFSIAPQIGFHTSIHHIWHDHNCSYRQPLAYSNRSNGTLLGCIDPSHVAAFENQSDADRFVDPETLPQAEIYVATSGRKEGPPRAIRHGPDWWRLLQMERTPNSTECHTTQQEKVSAKVTNQPTSRLYNVTMIYRWYGSRMKGPWDGILIT